jgi:hypothetical protein
VISTHREEDPMNATAGGARPAEVLTPYTVAADTARAH